MASANSDRLFQEKARLGFLGCRRVSAAPLSRAASTLLPHQTCATAVACEPSARLQTIRHFSVERASAASSDPAEDRLDGVKNKPQLCNFAEAACHRHSGVRASDARSTPARIAKLRSLDSRLDRHSLGYVAKPWVLKNARVK